MPTSTNNLMESAMKSKQTRATFVSMKKMDGKRYLFLEDTNLRDSHLMQQIAVERPYLKVYGKKEKGWEVVATNLSNTKIGLDKKLFDTEGVSVKQIKNRFSNIMAWCKKW